MKQGVLLLKKLKQWYYDLPIKLKLYITNIIIIIIPMLLLLFTANKVSTDIIVEKHMGSTVQGLNIISKSIDSLVNQVEYLSQLTVNDNNLQQSLRISKEDTYKLFKARSDIVKSLNSLVGDSNIINSIIIYNNDGNILNSGQIDSDKLSYSYKESINFIKAAEEAKGQVSWRSTLPMPYYSQKSNVDCISLFRALVEGSTGKVNGSIEIDVAQENISQMFSTPEYGNFDETFIIDKDGRIVSAAKKERLYTNVSNEKYFSWIINNHNTGKLFDIGKEKYLVTSIKYDRIGWYIVGFTPLNNLISDNIRVTYLIFLIGLLCISLAVITSILNSRSITRPIISLAKDMANASEGDMGVSSAVLGDDEVGRLSKSFNNMLSRISILMENVYKEQKKKREYELLALQSQINPHFLYNTLESVCSLSKMSRNEDVYTMVKSLAMFYRSVLSDGKNIISIKEELESIRHYLNIQGIRYGDKFDYIIDVEDDILNNSIVKLSMQPMLENAIYHGVRQKPDKGMIWILGKKEQENIQLSIIDNGVGLEESRFNSILSGTNENKGRKGYGLKNVNDRLKLYFGDEYGLRFSNIQSEGTRIDIILPIVTFDSQGELL